MTHGAAHGELQGSLCTLLLVLLCIVALLTARSGSIFAYLRIIVGSSLAMSLRAIVRVGFIVKDVLLSLIALQIYI